MTTIMTFSRLTSIRSTGMSVTRLLQGEKEDFKKVANLLEVAKQVSCRVPRQCFSSSNFLLNEKDHVKCWKCHTDLTKDASSIFNCPGCKSMRHPENYDYFQVFNIDQSYDIDIKDLSDRFKALQRMFHPDIFAQKPDEEKALSEIWSSLVNVAYDTLQKPHLRANYLLKSYGESIDEEQMTLDPEFLSSIMEFNEEINEAVTPDEIIQIRAKIIPVLGAYDIKVKEAFAAQNIQEAKKVISELQYFVNLKEKIIQKEMDNGIVD